MTRSPQAISIRHAYAYRVSLLKPYSPGQEYPVQFLKRIHLRYRYEVVPSHVTDQALHPTLLLWLRRGGEVGLEEVVGPERDKGILFLSISSSQHLAYS